MRLNPLKWLLIPLLVAGCSGAGDGPSASQGPDAAGPEDMTDAELRSLASCERPRQYAVSLREGACVDVRARRGAWVASPLSPELPADLATRACIFKWTPDLRARPDKGALEALPSLDALVPMCGASAEPREAVARKIPNIDNLTMGGAVGCDVCGVVGRERKLWAILPARTYLKQLEIPLSNGTSQAFQIESEVEAGVLEIELPADLPRGVAYAQGRVAIW